MWESNTNEEVGDVGRILDLEIEGKCQMSNQHDTPGMQYFCKKLLREFDYGPEHKSVRQRYKYLTDVVDAVRGYDDLVLKHAIDTLWAHAVRIKDSTMPTIDDLVGMCERRQKAVNKMNNALKRIMVLNYDPHYTDPDLTRAKNDLWWSYQQPKPDPFWHSPVPE
jgi:hypothetical protein